MRNVRLISRRLYQIMQLTLIIGLPSTMYFMISGHDLATALYKDALAGSVLAYIAPVAVFIYIRDPLAAMLQGLNKATLSTVISLVTSAIRMYCIYVLVAIPGHGIYGLASATAITAIVGTLIYLYFVGRYVTIFMNWPAVARIIIATGLATAIIHQIHEMLAALSPAVQVALSAGIGGFIYALALIYMKVIQVANIERLPWLGPIMARIFRLMPFLS